jgi:hypothetical protein
MDFHWLANELNLEGTASLEQTWAGNLLGDRAVNEYVATGGSDARYRRRLLSDQALTLGAYVLFAVLVALDLSLPKVSFAVLFALPLLVLASRTTGVRRIWPHVILLIVAIYASYYIKYRWLLVDEQLPLLSARLFNRTFAAVMLVLLAGTADAWFFWQRERAVLDSLERHDEDEVNSAAALIGCIGLASLVFVLDLICPADINAPIFFIVPLYLSSWVGKRRVLWLTAAAVIVLTLVGYLTSLPPNGTPGSIYLVVNRTMVVAAILIMTTILDFRLHWQQRWDVQRIR